jgi:hypothetical protein
VTGTWQQQMTGRLTTVAPAEPDTTARDVTRPPVPRWAERLADRAVRKPSTDQPAA